MLDLKLIRSQPEEIAENCRKRNVQVDIEKLLMLDKQVRHITTEADVIRQRRNDISKRMTGKIPPEVRQLLIEESKTLRQEESAKESKLRELIEQRLDLHKQVPNLTHPDSPEGFSDEDNVPIREVGTKREFDFEGGAKVSGQKFYYLKNQAVFLELEIGRASCRERV